MLREHKKIGDHILRVHLGNLGTKQPLGEYR